MRNLLKLCIVLLTMFSLQAASAQCDTRLDVDVILSHPLMNCGDQTAHACIIALSGTPNYTFNWSHGYSSSAAFESCRTNLAAGYYYVEVIDQNGCYGGVSFTIDDPCPPSKPMEEPRDERREDNN